MDNGALKKHIIITKNMTIFVNFKYLVIIGLLTLVSACSQDFSTGVREQGGNFYQEKRTIIDNDSKVKPNVDLDKVYVEGEDKKIEIEALPASRTRSKRIEQVSKNYKLESSDDYLNAVQEIRDNLVRIDKKFTETSAGLDMVLKGKTFSFKNLQNIGSEDGNNIFTSKEFKVGQNKMYFVAECSGNSCQQLILKIYDLATDNHIVTISSSSELRRVRAKNDDKVFLGRASYTDVFTPSETNNDDVEVTSLAIVKKVDVPSEVNIQPANNIEPTKAAPIEGPIKAKMKPETSAKVKANSLKVSKQPENTANKEKDLKEAESVVPAVTAEPKISVPIVTEDTITKDEVAKVDTETIAVPKLKAQAIGEPKSIKYEVLPKEDIDVDIKWPIKNEGPLQVSGFFGEKGPYRKTTHKGLDLAYAKGTAVQAGVSGVIKEKASLKGKISYGNYIVITYIHPTDPSITYDIKYAHLDHFGSFKKGDTVTGDQVVGYVGKSGTKSYHLHMEVTRYYFGQEDDEIDPLYFFGYNEDFVCHTSKGFYTNLCNEELEEYHDHYNEHFEMAFGPMGQQKASL